MLGAIRNIEKTSKQITNFKRLRNTTSIGNAVFFTN